MDNALLPGFLLVGAQLGRVFHVLTALPARQPGRP
jgi:hypothetical protein